MIKIVFYRDYSILGYRVFAHRYTKTGRIPYRITIEEMPEVSEGEYAEPSCEIQDRVAEEFFSALVTGLQEIDKLPKDTSTDAELKATIRHLKDMRALVFETVHPGEIQ